MEQISLTFPFGVVEVFTGQFLLLHPRTRLVPWTMLYRGFRTFPQNQKVRRWVRTRGSELGADNNPWTPAACADSMALEEDELETESELEEDAVTRFADGFRPLRVCTRFLELHMGRPVRGVPKAIGAPSDTHGLSFTSSHRCVCSSWWVWHARRCATTGARKRSTLAALEFHSLQCFGGVNGGWGGGGRRCLSAFSWE